MKNCSYCAEEIKSDAIKCRYCGERLNQQSAKQTVSPVKSKASDSLNFKDKILSKWDRMSLGARALTVFLVILVICFVGIIILAIEDSNQMQKEELRQQAVQKQRVEEQAVQTQEAESESLLSDCPRSCSSGGFFIDRLMDKSGGVRANANKTN